MTDAPRGLPRLVAFDLDGTLVDSLHDLTDSANQLLDEHGAAPLSREAVGPVDLLAALGDLPASM